MRKLILTYGSWLFACLTIMIVLEVKNSWGRSVNVQYDFNVNNPKALSVQNITGFTIGTWTGTKDTKWEEPSNWFNGQLPNSTVDVIIPSGGNQPIINVSAECHNITINTGATLTVSDANVLSVFGDWNNNGNFIANAGTVIFGGAIQDILGTNTFQNVTIAGTGRKSFSLPITSTVNGVLSIEGDSPLLNANPTYGSDATLRYNSSSARTTGLELPSKFTAKGGIIIDNTGPITLVSPTTFSLTLNDGVPLIINPGASLIISGQTIIFGGDFHNYGTLSLDNTGIIIGPGNATQFVDGFSTTGTVSITKSGGAVTLMGNVTGGALKTTGAGTLNLGDGLVHTFSGTWERGNGTLNGGSSTLRLGSGYSGSDGFFNSEDGTVEWFSSNSSTIYPSIYNILIISGSGIKTSSSKIYIKRMMTIEKGAQLDQTNSIEKLTSINQDGYLNIHGLLRVGNTFPTNFSIFNTEDGTVEYYFTSLQTIIAIPYNNLILSGDSKVFNGPIQISGNLTIKNGAKCNLSTYVSTANTLTLGDYGQVSGDWGGNFVVTYKNSNFFTNSSGNLIVANNSAIPGLWLGRNSEWATASNWSDGVVPSRSTDAIITSNGSNPEINSSASCKNLVILPNSGLVINKGNTLSISQDWNNQGTFTTTSGTVIFDGENQVIGKGPYYNLTIGNKGIKKADGVLVSGILSIEGIATLSNTISYMSSTILQYNNTTARTIGNEWPGTQTISGIKLINGDVALSGPISLNNTPLTINEGATLDTKGYNWSSSAIYLQCGGKLKGSTILGSGTLTLAGDVTVSNSKQGIAAAVIENQLKVGSHRFYIEDGNINAAEPTDLFINKIISGTLTKTGTGTMSIKDDCALNSLEINMGDFIIQPMASLSLNGILKNNAGTTGLSILSNETSTGSLLNTGSASGPATFIRSLTAGTIHLITSPLGGQTINSFLSNNATIQSGQGAFSDYRNMRDYNPSANDWNDFFKVGPSATTGSITPGKGYSIRVKNSQAHQVVFTGTLPSGDIIISGLAGGFWNCIGNPYTSAIMINSSGSANTRFLENNINNLDPAFVSVYVWDPATNPSQYITISNATDPYNIQQGQAFMVKVKTGISSVNFNRNMQTKDLGLALKSTDNIWATINLVATVDSISSSTTIAFHEGMTPGLDVSYDAGLLKAESPIYLYTRLVDDYGIPFAIQALPTDQYDRLIIPLGVDYSQGGQVTFSARAMYLPSACRPILEDRMTGIKTDLTDQTYTTDLTPSSAETGRFYLHMSYASTGIDNYNHPNSFSARFTNPDQLSIQGMAVKNALIILTDALGREVISRAIKEEDGKIITISLPALKPGLYILTIRSSEMVQSRKLVYRY